MLETFLVKAASIHADRYDYSHVLYVNAGTPIEIVCKIHGSFKQKPTRHLSGRGCPACGIVNSKLARTKMTSWSELKKMAAEAHPNRSFVYETFENKKRSDNIVYLCEVHQKRIVQTMTIHLLGRGCLACERERIDKSMIAKNKIAFESKAILVHGNRYVYGEYYDSRTKISIHCPDHGVFVQMPPSHLKGAGCPKCGVKKLAQKQFKGTSRFVEQAISVHGDRFDYSASIYTGARDYIAIVCRKHGAFNQMAGSHLAGIGCPKCTGHVSKKETKWLDALGVTERQTAIRIYKHKRRSKVDGFDPNTNTIYLFHGDYWHGNPKRFARTDINTRLKKTMGELYDETIAHENAIRDAGFNLVVKWETE